MKNLRTNLLLALFAVGLVALLAGCGGGGGRRSTTSPPPGVEDCNDGADNDGDGDIDCTAGNADADCPCGAETTATGRCNDGVDNDGDGATDGGDTGCTPPPVGENCNDGVDNDNDGAVDCADTVCQANESITHCFCNVDDFPHGPNSRDDDGDGVINGCDNCDDDQNPGQTDRDLDEHGDACDCRPTDASSNADAEEICDDGVDNDCDEDVDEHQCDSQDSGEDCTNDADDDGDGKVDCADHADCPNGTPCALGTCRGNQCRD